MRTHRYFDQAGRQPSRRAELVENARRRRWGRAALISLAVVAASCSSAGEDGAGVVAASAPTSVPTATSTPSEVPTEAPTPAAEVAAEVEVEAEDGPAVVIEADMVFDPDRFNFASGTFEVIEGIDVLGCSSGTMMEAPGRDGIDDKLTCQAGDRTGSTLTLRVLPGGTSPTFFSDWTLVASTGEYDDATASGDWVGRINDEETGASVRWTGDIAFGEVTSPVATLPRLTQFRDSSCGEGFVSEDGLTEFMTVDDVLHRLDITTGEVIEHGPAPAGCAYWLGDEAAGRRVAISESGETVWLGPLDGPWDTTLEFEQRADLLSRSIAANRLLIRQWNDIVVLDATTGQQVGSPITGNFADTRRFQANAVNADGTLIAIGDGGTDGGRIMVFDAQTAEPVFQIDTVTPVTTLTFDEPAGELIAGLFTGELLTVDVAAGEVVSTVAIPTTSTIAAIGLRPDGLVVVYSGDVAELVDRRTGPTGQSITIRNSAAADIQPDGAITTVSTAQELVIYELDE